MNRTKLIASAAVAALGMATVVGSIATADPAKDAKPAAAKEEMKLPPGMTAEDMQAFAAASTPGKMHEHLMRDAGTWEGKNSMWMGPDATEPVASTSTTKITPIMDGRFIQVEASGDMPGMGPYKGLGLYGYDNAGQKFVSTWVDNMATGMMTGTGELSSDGKTLTWNYTTTCAITKKPVAVRQVETITGENTKTLEMWGPDPKSGKEFKMMRIEMTRKS